MTTKFKAHGTFTVPGRGLVVAGEILGGMVKVGMNTRVPSWPTHLTIAGVVHGMPVNVGLLFASQNEAEFTRWKALDLQGKVLEIQEGIPKAVESDSDASDGTPRM
jgi:hypothetical protein